MAECICYDSTILEIKNEELRMKNAEIIGLSDVTNILCGPEGAAFTFAVQKGATAEQVRLLDEALKHYASIVEHDLHRNVSHLPGSGAAGGLGAGLLAFCNAKIFSGIDFVLDLLSFRYLFSNVIVLSPPKEHWIRKRFTEKESKASHAVPKNSTNRSMHSPERFSERKPSFKNNWGLQHFTRYRLMMCQSRKQ